MCSLRGVAARPGKPGVVVSARVPALRPAGGILPRAASAAQQQAPTAPATHQLDAAAEGVASNIVPSPRDTSARSALAPPSVAAPAAPLLPCGCGWACSPSCSCLRCSGALDQGPWACGLAVTGPAQ